MDRAVARDAALAEVAESGFKVHRHGDWGARAKRGNKMLKNAIGATGLAAYAEMEIDIRTVAADETLVELSTDQKGYAKGGGFVRGARSAGYFDEAVRRVTHRFRTDGVLVGVVESE